MDYSEALKIFNAHRATLEALLNPPVDQYAKFIHREAHRCLGKLPPMTIYTEPDLFQEGVVLLMEIIPRWNPRRGKLMTLLYRSLHHRYGRLVRKEWRRESCLYRACTVDDIEQLSGTLTAPVSARARGAYTAAGLAGTRARYWW